MDFAFFSSLSESEGQSFLEAFIRIESVAVVGMVDSAKRQGIQADFSVETLPSVMSWVLSQVKVVSKSPDASLPEWITSTAAYSKGLFEFSDASKPLVLRTAYYLGECFVRRFGSRLRWAVGNQETAKQNMPVVTGFNDSGELAPILVTENLFRRILRGGARDDSVEQAIDWWVSHCS